MAGSGWTTPRQGIAAECQRRGTSAVVSGCIDLLEGREVDDGLILALGGPPAGYVLSGHEGGREGYWPRVWAARGLLHAWDDGATAAIIRATTDDAWRVREMAAKVIARYRVGRAPEGEPALDDAAFLVALARRLQPVNGDGAARPVFLAGLSNGGGFAEHVARHGLLPVAGLFLVVPTIREFSVQAEPVPRQRIPVTIMAGTGDPRVPYEGGALSAREMIGLIMRRRNVRHGDPPAERRVAPVEEVARDWAVGNGIAGEPTVERLPEAQGDPPVTRLTWSAPTCPPVVLYRIEGGGHGWPGGPQFLPARLVGPIPRHLDATGILLDLVTAGSLRRAYRRGRWLIGSVNTGAVPAGSGCITWRSGALRVRKGLLPLTEALTMAEDRPSGTGHA